MDLGGLMPGLAGRGAAVGVEKLGRGAIDRSVVGHERLMAPSSDQLARTKIGRPGGRVRRAGRTALDHARFACAASGDVAGVRLAAVVVDGAERPASDSQQRHRADRRQNSFPHDGSSLGGSEHTLEDDDFDRLGVNPQ